MSPVIQNKNSDENCSYLYRSTRRFFVQDSHETSVEENRWFLHKENDAKIVTIFIFSDDFWFKMG